jgi:hypothetical protein
MVMNLMGMVSGLVGGGQKVEASALQSVIGLVQQHTSGNEAPQGNEALAAAIAGKLGLNAGMVSMVVPQITQAVQSGALTALLDKNKDGQIDLSDLMALLKP